MDIVKEIPSRTGNISTNTIRDCTKLDIQDNVNLKGFNQRQDVIWVINQLGRYPIAAFPNKNKRDQAYEHIVKSHNTVVVLDFNIFFTENYATDDFTKQCLRKMKINLQTHIYSCISKILEKDNISLPELLERDAFKSLSIKEMERFLQQDKVNIDPSIAALWAKTLHTPASILRMGISPLQFFKILCEQH